MQTGVCDVGELGLVYERYDRGLDSEGYSILFASGRHDGFSPDEISQMIQITDELEPSMVGYQFSNVTALSRDYERGCFRFSTSN